MTTGSRPASSSSWAPTDEFVTESNATPPKIVMDGWGNLWQHYGDTGYLRLMVTTDPGRTLAEILTETGTVTAMALASPMILLREQVSSRSRWTP